MPWRHHENKPEMEEFEGVPQQRGLAGLGLHMGQGQSSPQVGEAGSSNVAAHIASKTFAIGSAAASSTGKNIKRAFNVRRKKPPSLAPDEIAAFAEPASSSKKTLNAFGAGKLPANPVSDSSVPVVSDEPAEYSEPHQSTPAPAPAPPPKPVPSPPASSSQHAFPNRGSSLSHSHPPPPQVQRASIIPMTPGISHAVRYMRQGEGNSPDSPQFGLTSAKEEERDEKENWRKSDSTISHRTIRPAAGMGSRTPRPGSIVTPLPEDDDLSSVEDSSSSSSYSHFNQSRPSLGTRNDSSSTWPSQELGQPVYPHRQSGETPSLSKAAAEGFIGPSSNGFQSTSNNIRGRLAAWTTTTKNAAPASTDAHPHHKGSSSIASQTSLVSSNGGNAPRSTSISNGFGPAAGFAKRAVEKMGRALGGMSSASSGYSSSDSSSNPPSSFHGGGMLTRTDSDTSSGVDHKGKHGRTPNAPSGAWSIASSTNTGASSESDLPSGPFLGDMLRPPIQPEGGVVFGRALSSVVQRTPLVPVPHHPRSTEELVPGLNEKIVAIGQRMIPAVAARSAQHVMLWGIEEEGLFRVNGRPSHVNKLRSEFDTGADYNMSRCSPGELDPHAVAGVFKAFLRELPEPLLTRGLMPYFDAAMQQESNRNESNTSSSSATAKARGPGLPSGPRAGIPLRKPPSLSTLAMPNLQGLKSASPELIKALRSLISKLPQENKDLLLTVVDLIKATASQYRVTKMPLSNLLLVFCPSLHMSPPLLRTLAECDALWQDQQVPIDEVPETPTPGGRAAEPVEQREPLSDPSTDPSHVSPPETSFDTSDVLDIRRQTLGA
ncbi:hypothetical protein DL96DRAFT_1707133 [Flagelloscypha sp. PMI_526]|nr:hypothetical protein DL96DRAFT_1707133 [Flagelloscypha sp. PMI_526]